MTAPSLTAAGPWIPVTERMPKELDRVLVWDDLDGEHIAQWIDADEKYGACWLSSDGFELDHVTHWAAITPPGEEPTNG